MAAADVSDLLEVPVQKGDYYMGGDPYLYRALFFIQDPGNAQYCGTIFHNPRSNAAFDGCDVKRWG
jgi:hypothetical protein